MGVYAYAVHAKWLDKDNKVIVMAVASEPEIFWTGEGVEKIIADKPGVESIITKITIQQHHLNNGLLEKEQFLQHT